MTAAVPFPPLRRGLVAILRGLTTDEVEPVVGGLIEAGFEAIEIPLNSPEPYRSIERAVRLAPAGVLIGAGTVLETAEVERLGAIGARLVVSPNIAPEVVRRAGALGMVTMPGVMTPTEAFLALAAGASALKFFPASLLGPAGIKAVKAVLPRSAALGAVGGVGPADFGAYHAAGITLFGLGSNLYAPGMAPAEVAARGREAVAAFDRLGI